MTKAELKMSMLAIISTFHTLSPPILLGFFASNEGREYTSFHWVMIVIGLVLYMLTYIAIFSSYDDSGRGDVRIMGLIFSFFLTFGTNLIFIILVMSNAFSP